MTFERIHQPPHKFTFQMPRVREWVESRLEGPTLNLFGGLVRVVHPKDFSIIHNEINPELPADIRLDSYDIVQWQDYASSFDTVIVDPPFTAHQAVVTYGMKKAQQITHARDVVDWVLRPNGRVISLGFNSTGMNMSRGYEKEALLLVNHGASHNDMIVLSERRTK